jgi:fatty acid desaturase
VTRAPVERWRSWRAEQREERLERLARQLQAGGTPVAGGFALKLFALAIFVALLVAFFLFAKFALDAV